MRRKVNCSAADIGLICRRIKRADIGLICRRIKRPRPTRTTDCLHAFKSYFRYRVPPVWKKIEYVNNRRAVCADIYETREQQSIAMMHNNGFYI